LEQKAVYGDLHAWGLEHLEGEKQHVFNGVSPTVSSWKARLKADLLLLLHRAKSSSHHVINQLVDSL
jgi:hypothetical protein